MNLMAMKNVVTGKIGRQILMGKKHAPLVLFAVGTVGVVTAAVLACRATLKLEEVLDETDKNVSALKDLREQDDITEKEYNQSVSKEYFKAGVRIARMYSFPVILGAASIASLTGSHVMLTNRYASVAAAYTALDKGFRAYRSRVVEKLGKEQDLEFRHGVQEMEIVEEAADGSGPVIKTIKRAAPNNKGSVYARWFNESCAPWRPEASLNYVFLKAQEEHWNWKLQQDGYVMLNDVYHALGLPRRKMGQMVGWRKDAHEKGTGDGYISFGIFEGESKNAIDFMNGWEKSVLIDPNVDGIMYQYIDEIEPC